jgi:hypothetical protein
VATDKDPLMAAAMPVFIGADYLFKKIAETSAGRKVLKKLGYTPGRSKASAESIIQGFKGTFSGLKKALD